MAFSTHDQVPDSPTNVFATLNSLHKNSGVTLLDGNTKYSNTSSSNKDVSSTIIIPSTTGLWYIEFFQVTGLQADVVFGFGSPTYDYISSPDLIGSGNFIGYTYSGRKWSFGTQTNNLTTLTVNTDVLTFCIDSSNGKAWAGKNGVWFASGDPSTGANPFYTFTAGTKFVVGIPIYNSTGYVNFGQDSTFGGTKSPSSTYTDANGIGSFYYQPPTGALALCTANLPDPDIDPALDDLPEDYFKAVKYTGQTNETGVSTWDSNTSTGTVICGFPVDLAWIKVRNAVGGHRWYDTVRGANQILISNETSQERTFANEVIGFNSTGFNNGNASTNASGATYIAWCFRAGGAPTADNTATSGAMTANSVSVDGTLQSSYTPSGSPTIYPTRMSINTKAGFSIVKVTKSAAQYSYDTYPHGLSKAPDFIITKSLNSSTEHWYCYHSSITPDTGYSARIQLNQSNQATLNSTIWGSPTNITDNIIAWDGAQNLEQIFYCWHSVAGHSAFGSYTGNGSTDGPFVYTGFKPAWLLVKNIDLAGDWWLMDTTRDTYNVAEKVLYPNLSVSEYVGASVFGRDFLSNGFKVRNNNFGVNGNYTYIYAAFAEQPFKYATAR